MNPSTERRVNTTPPLDGIRVLAVEQYGAGPWATMLLADLGAEVIKIENPETDGDIGRHVPPYTSDGDSIYFQSFNRNKKSITLNLRHDRAHEALHPLVEVSDCVFNNLRGDLPARLGLDYESLGPVRPSVVCCSLSAFGREGPRAAEPGYDYLMQAYSGWMSVTGDPDGPPQKAGLSIVDLSAGAMAAIGILAAALRARRSGIGCDVDVSLFETALSELAYVAAWHLSRGYEPRRLPDSSHPSMVPSQSLPTRDGWMVVMCAKEKFYRELVRIMGRPDLAEDPRFGTFADRLDNRDALVPILKELSVRRTTAEWLEMLRGRVPCAPVNTVAEALQDPLAAREGLILDTPHPSLGAVRQVASPIRIGDVGMSHRRGPLLGEHTDEVLGDLLGWERGRIERARAHGLI